MDPPQPADDRPSSRSPATSMHIPKPAQWSAADTPQHHLQGTSYFSVSSSVPNRPLPPPVLVQSSSSHSMRRPGRSTSVGSAQTPHRSHRDSVLSEEDEDVDETKDTLGQLDSGPRRSRGKATTTASPGNSTSSGSGEDDEENRPNEDDPITLKDRQSLINVQHPFGLPIWKPALYKKSRSVTRHADEALHSVPSYQAERHLIPGNIFWALAFGWWLAVVCFVLSSVLWMIPRGGKQYARLVFGLGWYLVWPFGKYVEGDLDRDGSETEQAEEGDGEDHGEDRLHLSDSDGNATVRAASPSPPVPHSNSWDAGRIEEGTALLHFYKRSPIPAPIKAYGCIPSPTSSGSISVYKSSSSGFLGKACFWIVFVCVIAPLMLFVCLICWALIVTIPMAKLNWALIQHLYERPDSIRFCAAPPVVVVANQPEGTSDASAQPGSTPQLPKFSIKHARLAPGEAAPSGTSTVLLCTYRAIGFKYYKYTVGGVNIFFVNLLPVVFLIIFDGFVLLPWAERLENAGKNVPPILALFASQGFVFIMSLLSVIPLSYFIGMAVASISAQSSIGMGAVINATFGSIIEIILYAFALTQGRGCLVEGSIVGSLLAGVLLMPGMSMCGGAVRRKEQRFNAKSAGVTSMMLIMAIIGTLAPTLFYQTFGNVRIHVSKVPDILKYWISSSNSSALAVRLHYMMPRRHRGSVINVTTDTLIQFTIPSTNLL